MLKVKWRNFAVFGVIFILSVGLLTSCGDKEKTKLDEKAALTGEVKIAAATGTPYVSVSKLPKDYKVLEVEDLTKVEEALVSAQCDLAVLPALEASKLYNSKGGFKVISTLSLGNWQIASNGQNIEDPLKFLSGKKIYAVSDDKGEDIVHTSEAVVKALMAQDKRELQIEWKEKNAFLKAGKKSEFVGLAKKATIEELISSRKDEMYVMDIGTLWQEKFKSNIPEYVLVGREDFLSARGDEVEAIMNDLAENLETAQKDTEDKLVVYNASDRGIDLVRKFNEIMAENNLDAIGGKKPSQEYYFYK